jgi:hypothetical protein
MAPTVLAPVVCRRLSAMPIEPVIDSIGPAGYRVNNPIGRNVGSGIEVGRAEIVQVYLILTAGRVISMVTHFLVRGE